MASNVEASRPATLTPQGLGMTQFVFSCVFAVLTSIVVVLRCWVRTQHKVFGVDDALMLFGWILFMGLVGVSCQATFYGMGAKEARIDAEMMVNGKQFVWLFQIFYCATLALVKGSICVTLLRIAVVTVHRVIAWITLATAVISALIVLISLLAICDPISDTWDPPPEGPNCAAPAILAILSYLVSVASLITDLTCAILPGFMLYKANMKTAKKITITLVLGLGAIASVATLIRMPYMAFYFDPAEEYMYKVCHVALWCLMETGIGIFAGSLPPLRKLIKRWVHFDSSNGHSSGPFTPYSGSHNLGVSNKITTASRSQRFNKGKKSSDGSKGGDQDGNWERLDDDSSKRRIYVTVDMEMQTMGHGATSVGSHDSIEELAKPTR